MPAVDASMERSLRRGFVDVLAATMQPVVEKRDAISNIQGSATDVKTAFSSWDNCMQASFCKWPVIAIMIIGGLIIFSVVWCIIRCACCGVSCCCSCFHCLKCCGNCCGMCDPPRGTPHKHLDDPYSPPTQGYRSQEPMTAARTVPNDPKPPFLSDTPQYAVFETSKKGGDGDGDALPAMPSWEGATQKKVAVEDDSMEMSDLKKPENVQYGGPVMSGARAGSASPGATNGSQFGAQSSGYLASGASRAGPYGAGAQPYNNAGYGQGYGQSTSSLATNQGYGVAATGAMGAGRRSPQTYNNHSNNSNSNPYDQNSGYGVAQNRRMPPPRGQYGQDPARQTPQQDYGYDQRGYGQSGYDQAGYDHGYDQGYGQGYDQDYSQGSYQPSARQAPERQYSNSPAPPSPTDLTNSGGFDFNSGYSRPQQYNYNRKPSQPERQNTGGSGPVAYPGYKPYQPAVDDSRGQDGWSGL